MPPKKWFLAFFQDGELPQAISKPFDTEEEAMEEYNRLGDKGGVCVCETIYG